MIVMVKGPIIIYKPNNFGKRVFFNNIAPPLNKAANAKPENTIIEKIKCKPNSVVLSSLNSPIPNNPITTKRSEIKPRNPSIITTK